MSRRGFTLFQILIMLALLAVLAGLALPFLAKMREQAVRMQSQTNLKQIAIACHAYHDTTNTLPSGLDNKGFSAAAYLLPYIEQGAAFNRIDFQKSIDDKANAEARATRVTTFVNPLDPVKQVTMDFGPTNYLFSAGTKYGVSDNNGVFTLNSKLSLLGITDGVSNTMLATETLKGDSGVKATDVRRQHVLLKAESFKDLTGKSGLDNWKNDKNIQSDRCASWMDGRFLQGTFTATRKINDAAPDVNCAGTGGLSGPRSMNDAVYVSFCDGSTRAIKSSINFQVWQAIATYNGSEAIPNDF